MDEFYGWEMNDLEWRTIPYEDITSMSWSEPSNPREGAVVSVDGDNDTRLDLCVHQDDLSDEEWAQVVYQLEELWTKLRWYSQNEDDAWLAA